MDQLIENPTSIDRAAIEVEIAAGNRVVLQFSKLYYSPELLRKINNLCGELGRNLEVRFYGHTFDASVVRFLPEAAALSIDCVYEATNLIALNDLKNLRRLSLGIYKLDDPQILKSLHIQNLNQLSLNETVKANIDLAPLESCGKLEEFYLEGHTKNISQLADLPALRMLTLRRISKKQSLDFVSRIQSLKRLVIILGGRDNISEIQHPTLEALEIRQVMGFSNFESIDAFPALRALVIEDQIRLKSVRFTPSNKGIQSFRIFNCKNLHVLEGLDCLAGLKSIRIGMTALDVDTILNQRLSTSLKEFGFYTGKAKANAKIRQRLDSLGYRE